MTNTKRKNALDEIRNPKQNRIRYQKRIQEEREAEQRLREDLKTIQPEDAFDDPLPKIS